MLSCRRLGQLFEIKARGLSEDRCFAMNSEGFEAQIDLIGELLRAGHSPENPLAAPLLCSAEKSLGKAFISAIPGLFTNRLLWLGASARVVGLGLPQPRAPRVCE